MPDLRLLLVEDEQLLDRVVSDALRSIGLACEIASCAATATECLQAHQFDLMILDLRLQGGSGVSVLQQARSLYPEMPVILVTAYTMTDEVRHALALGVDALLYKPFDIDTLLATVRTLLRRRVMPVASHAVVSAAEPRAAPPVRQMGGLPTGALATLKGATLALACRVRQMDEHALSVETECIELIPAARWQLEWTGDDALYQFTTRLLEYRPRETTTLWLLRLPTRIRRIQRRRSPRVPLSGRAFVSVAGRLQRAAEASLIDLSETGACIVMTEPPHRGATMHIEVHADTEQGALRFQREGVVRSVVAFTEAGEPRYRVGLQLERLPADALKRLRQLRLERLVNP